MPNYQFKCHACQAERDEIVSIANRDLPMDCPSCGGKESSSRVFEPTSATIVPDWMSASRSWASDRQAVYLKSEKHRKNRETQERTQEAEYQRSTRIAKNREKLSRTIEARVDDNARYPDQSPQAVTERAKKYRATKFAS